MLDWWDLSDDELRVRLRRRRDPVVSLFAGRVAGLSFGEIVREVVRRRDDPVIAELIDEALQ